jgi:hypothetical protein
MGAAVVPIDEPFEQARDPDNTTTDARHNAFLILHSPFKRVCARFVKNLRRNLQGGEIMRPAA